MMDEFEDTIVARPALKRLAGLLPGGVDSAPAGVLRALRRDDLSEALDAANRRWSKRGAADRIGAVTYATLLVVRELLDEAGGVLEKAERAHPADAALSVLRAERQLLRDTASDATETLAAIELDRVEEAGVASLVGDLFLDLGDVDAGRRAYRRAVELGSRDVEVLLRLGQLALDEDERETAAEAFERAAKIAGDRVGLWESAADAWFQLGEDARGLAAYGEVLQLEPSGSEDWLHHGLALARTGETRDAEEALERCVELDPFNLDAWVTLGQVRMQMGEAEAALAAFEKAREQAAGDVDALMGVVSASLVIGDLNVAEETARRAVEALPEDPEAHHSLGVVLQERGRYDDAVAVLEAAVELADDMGLPSRSYQTSLALAVLASGDVSRATSLIEGVLDDEPAGSGVAAEFVEGLMRHGAFAEAQTFMESVSAAARPESLIYPLSRYVIAAYGDGGGDAHYDEAVEAIEEAGAQALPLDWDFSHLERLSLRMGREQKRRFERLVGVLEGRREIEELR